MKNLIGLLVLCVWQISVVAQPLDPEDVPEPLKPWIDWVLYGEADYQCPFVYSTDRQRTCAWPSELSLVLTNQRGRFTQQWQVYQDAWIHLPGDQQHWPQSVTLNDQPALVMAQQQRPAMRLKPGRYRISGEFHWDSLPEALQIPPATGLVSLTINNQPVLFPELANNGRLWLRERDIGKKDQGEGDKLGLQVFRQVIDDMPMRVITRLQLDVAGTQREVVLGPALLSEMIPLSLTSRLPARLEPDGSIRIQVRPGSWIIELEARQPADTTDLQLPATVAPWPQQEVWVFAAQNHLRLVEVEGVTIDPRQTSLPEAWQSLPAYLMKANDALRLKVIRRGDPQPEPDKLSLHRTLWLDFDGKGYTLHDKISGNMTSGWRLETQPSLDLGRVDIDGQPQFITRLPGSNQQGVEVRRGVINLSADSRYTTQLRRLPATGWDVDFQRVSAELNLPPGWLLFSASGVDNVPQTWLQRWTLLDLFLVLILSLAILRLWNWRWGLLALLTLTLIWHQSLAPQFVWVNILIAIALLRVVPRGKFHLLVSWYRNLSLLGLVLIVIPFAIQQVRIGLYPQLERPWQSMTSPTVVAGAVVSREKAEIMREAEVPQEAKKMRPDYDRFDSSLSYDKAINLAQIDPSANVQTGPGLPHWQWSRIQLSWNGPVERQQQVELVLVPPAVNMLLNFLRVILVILLGALMFGVRYERGKGLDYTNPFSSSTAMLLCGLLGLMGNLPQSAFATETGSNEVTPSPEILRELKQRLLAAPDCLPACAQVPRMRLMISPDHLRLQLEIHAQQQVAVPLPSHAQHWLPSRVMVDGQAAQSLYRTPGNGLWLGLAPGRHQIELAGVVPPRADFSLPLPLTPHYVSVEAEGWNVEGVHENGQADPQLQFNRLRLEGEQQQPVALEPGVLPPFVRVERTLRLGLEWQVETQVIRASPPGNPVVLAIPLLSGESPISPEGVRTQQNRVLVNMAPHESVYRWVSVLDRQAQINLVAPDTTDWLEVWRVDVSPIWHMETQGITVVHHRDQQQNWLPEWRPWPGETVTLVISKPAGIDGKTLTIDDSQIHISPGSRATDSTLSFSLRSSQGGQHTIQLPATARLQSVSIDGVSQPIRQEGNVVTLPIVPGKQTISLSWRTPQGIANLYRTELINLGISSTNATSKLNLGQDRWLLFSGGPRMGPAVLYWGVLIVLLLVALALGRVPLTPLKSWQWLLLAIGLSQVSLFMAAFIVIWLMLLGARCRLHKLPTAFVFNSMQIGLGVMTIFALVFLVIAVQQGLLGTPEMHVSGNQSSAYELNWYQDRSEAQLAKAWVLSVPLLFYRLLMLAWALWLAVSLLRWLRWGWECFSTTALWQHLDIKPRKLRRGKTQEPVHQAPAEKS